jgi:arylsulfatase A-like enzyme
MPDVLYQKSKEDKSTVIQYNDYDYAADSFFFRFDSNGRKLGRYLEHFARQGLISKALSEGEQHDTYTGYPYTPVQIDARYGFPTDTDLNTDNGFQRYETTQPNVVGINSMSENFTPSHFNGDVGIRALDRLLAQERPFLLTVSFHNPHPPMVPSWKHLDYYMSNLDNLFVSPSIHDNMANSDYGHAGGKYADEGKVKEWTAVYYALIEEIDDYVGMLLDRLGDAADNTMIIFTSDHGEMLGAHGKREKNNFYEEASKVPLLVSFPGKIQPQAEVDEMVSHLDVFATILDYVGASDVDNSDGTSLRAFIEATSYNQHFDEDLVVAEWDYRKPLLRNHKILDRRMDERPSLMIRKGEFKLMTQKLASSSKIDMMYDLSSDPFEMNNLVGTNGMITASDQTLSKAEHLRCLLIEWMQRLDGEKRYYSDPNANYGEGSGDIEELRKRQSWRTLDFWIGDSTLEFGKPVWNKDEFVRNEFLYLGTRTPGSITVSSIRVDGSDAGLFTVDQQQLLLEPNGCTRLKVAFASSTSEATKRTLDASIVVSREGSSSETVIPIFFSSYLPLHNRRYWYDASHDGVHNRQLNDSSSGYSAPYYSN